ncbi:MAG TPA: hypothetical protein VGO85_10540 [Caldimonas sp.]|nr:hypothetical protein [Caldimonas sp.]
MIATLEEMVLIESGSSHAAGLAKMAGYVEARLTALGASTTRIAPARRRRRRSTSSSTVASSRCIR